MAIAKITLTLEQDEERGTNEAMKETIDDLALLDTMPMMKLVLTLECEEMIADQYREKLRHCLRTRPIGIIAKIKTTSEEQVTREVMRPVTPMDKHFAGFADDGVDSVTLSGGGRSVTLTAETARNASAMLHTAGDENLFDDEAE